MPVGLRRGTVTAVGERLDGLVRIEVDEAPCVAYPHLTGPVALGDDVLVNVQARQLALGSGGFDVLYANLTRGLGLAPEPGAHVMKLPYTPLQHALPHAEERGGLPPALAGMPVVCCSLHSQLAPVCAALTGLRVAYAQLPGGALPVSLSDAVRALREHGLLGVAIGVGPCFGGDVECVTLAAALLWASREHDVAVCAIGPGIVGTGTSLGHGGLAAADAANAAARLGGRPLVTARVSDADPRERHRGLSHHTRAVLEASAAPLAWPQDWDAPDVRTEVQAVETRGWREACAGLPLSHMGRGPEDDARFFEAAFAAGVLARSRLP
jgi:hypothetical protein